ncbi:hypothetical protein L2Y94_07575 [Luteibacter aegosomatis]|uniref:hypothetical protein n=1 Tax=Luteibacter aegosomatis TaxID=2911537 RepID=UPI001FF85A4E|nr:hypothetical protein [Luteibacter aegosomatis]UPG87203.1 hypothetical protein L2Y94_07575 [Luteibacter aegosomatis]
MTVEVDVEVQDPISLAEFRSRVISKVDPSEPESLSAIARDLAALASDKQLMVRKIAADLAGWRSPEFSMYSAQSCILDRFGPFTVRANLWPSVVVSEGEEKALSYHAYHDHNFSFATVNLYGPGYKTDVYERVGGGAMCNVGDSVDLVHLGEQQLSPGKVVLYRKGVDVHAQIPPSSPSASINLILSGDDLPFLDQYYFDPSREMVVGMVENVVAKRLSVISLGKFIGSTRSLESLASISSSFPCVRTREAAAKLVAHLNH